MAGGASVGKWFCRARLKRTAMPQTRTPDPALIEALVAAIHRWRGAGLLTVGISGAQGSGKSTLAAALAARLAQDGVAAATLSLDDLYLGRETRRALAAAVHPLFVTRGPPGTHDVALGLATLDALARGEPAPLPRFDKALDAAIARADWPKAPRGCQVLLLEGWCLGARPQSEAALIAPVNALEAEEDAQTHWRRHANTALAGEYQQLWARIDHLILLAAPGWEVVQGWREQQEAELRAKAGADAPGVMDTGEVTRFIQHYERLTRHMLAELPGRADVVVRLGEGREVLGVGMPFGEALERFIVVDPAELPERVKLRQKEGPPKRPPGAAKKVAPKP